MSQEIGVWLKGLLTWNVFIFLDLVIATLEEGSGQGSACTLSWQVLEWNREVRIQMVAGEWKAMRKGVILTDFWLGELIPALKSGSLHILVSAKPCMLQGACVPVYLHWVSWEMSSSHYKVEKWPSSVQGSWLRRAHLPDTRQRQKEWRKKIRKRDKKEKGTENKESQEEENGQKWWYIVGYHSLGIGKEVGGDDQWGHLLEATKMLSVRAESTGFKSML